MRYKPAILSLALLAGSSELANCQAKAPAPADPATVKRLQDSIAQAEARGDLRQAQLDLRSLLVVYHNDPAMQTSIRAQLAQISAQIDSKAKASQRPAPAPALNPSTSAAAPTAAPSTVAPISNSQVSGAIPPPTPAPTSSNSNQGKFSQFMEKAAEIMAKAKEMRDQKAAANAQTRPAPRLAAQCVLNCARRRFRFLDAAGT